MSDVKIRILAEDKASAAINQVDKSLDKLAADAGVAGGKAGLGGLSASLGTTLTSVLGLVGGIGILAGAFTKVKSFVRDSINSTVEFAQTVRELSMAIGVNAEETSRLLQLADDYMINTSEMATALRFATKNGFEVSIESIARLADELRTIEGPTAQAAKMVEIFGRNWSVLTPLLNAGGDAIRANAAAIQDGLIIDNTATAEVFAYQQAMDNLNDSLEAVKLTVGTFVLPKITNFLEGFDFATKFNAQATVILNALGPTLTELNNQAIDLQKRLITNQDIINALGNAAKLGVEITPGNLVDIYEKLVAIEDPARRDAQAFLLFGANYQIMMQIIASGGLDDLVAGTEEIGVNLKTASSWSGSAATAMGQLTPIVQQMGEEMEVAAGKTQNLGQSLNAVTQAALAAAKGIIAARNAVYGFGDLSLDVAGATEELSKQMMFWQLGGEDLQRTFEQVSKAADFMKHAGILNPEEMTNFKTSLAMIEAEGKAIDFFMGEIEFRALREFAKENTYAAEAMAAVGARMIDIGEMDYSQVAQSIARAFQIPLKDAQNLIDNVKADMSFSATATVTVEINAVGDLWALNYGNLMGGGFDPGRRTQREYSKTGNSFAQGADFVVPGGHPADNFPVWVSSGERVTVTPASKVAGDTYYDIQINSMPSQSPSEIANSVVWKLNEHQRLSRAAGAGYAGR